MIKFVLSLGLLSIQVFYCQCEAQTSEKASSATPSERVSAEERQALIALYEATGGDHWKNHTGWLGAPGTECSWYGVSCGPQPDGSTRLFVVFSLDLSENNLKGSVPAAASALNHLEWLYLFHNDLSGVLPDGLIQRWLSGALSIAAEASLFTSVTEVDFENSASALLCDRHRIIFRADGSAIRYDLRCRNSTPDDRATFCEVRNGQIVGSGFGLLAYSLNRNHFYSLQPHYERNVTDSSFASTRVTRGEKKYEVVDYAEGGPFELRTIELMIEGIASTIDWEKPTTQPECPRWEGVRTKTISPAPR